MGCCLSEKKGYTEIRIEGKTDKHEILAVVGELHRRDPEKKRPDLWVLDEKSEFAFADLAAVAREIRAMFPPNVCGCRSALVGTDELHRAELEMYQAELELYGAETSLLPFEIGVFTDYAEAAKWVTQA